VSALAFLVLDDVERDVLDDVLDHAEWSGDDALMVKLWRLQAIDRDTMVVHGLADSGHLTGIPPMPKVRAWMVAKLDALAATADHAGRVQGWVPHWYVTGLARRIENDSAPAGERGSLRIGPEDLRTLIEAADATASRPATGADERAHRDQLAEVVERIGTLAAMLWSEPHA
jgi:hypothetical protein